MNPSDLILERLRATARTDAALIAMRDDDLSGAEKHLAQAIAHLQQAQRIQDGLKWLEMVTK